MSDPKRGTRAAGDWAARLRLHPTAFIAPGAVVVGDVTLGARSSVWFNVVLRRHVPLADRHVPQRHYDIHDLDAPRAPLVACVAGRAQP